MKALYKLKQQPVVKVWQRFVKSEKGQEFLAFLIGFVPMTILAIAILTPLIKKGPDSEIIRAIYYWLMAVMFGALNGAGVRMLMVISGGNIRDYRFLIVWSMAIVVLTWVIWQAFLLSP